MSEIVYESRGKLVGGSLSRGRKANSRPSENEDGDIYWCQRRWDTRSNDKETDTADTRSNEKETDRIQGIRDSTRDCVSSVNV